MINVVFSIMCNQEMPAEEEDDEDADDDDTPALAASQCLDILALNLPPEKYMTAVLAQVRKYGKGTPTPEILSLSLFS